MLISQLDREIFTAKVDGKSSAHSCLDDTGRSAELEFSGMNGGSYFGQFPTDFQFVKRFGKLVLIPIERRRQHVAMATRSVDFWVRILGEFRFKWHYLL